MSDLFNKPRFRIDPDIRTEADNAYFIGRPIRTDHAITHDESPSTYRDSIVAISNSLSPENLDLLLNEHVSALCIRDFYPRAVLSRNVRIIEKICHGQL